MFSLLLKELIFIFLFDAFIPKRFLYSLFRFHSWMSCQSLPIHRNGVNKIIIDYSRVFCKIMDFICTSLRSTEIVLDERKRVQCDICRTNTSGILINASMSEIGLTARTIANPYQSLRLEHKPLICFSMRRLKTYKSVHIDLLIFSCRPAWH